MFPLFLGPLEAWSLTNSFYEIEVRKSSAAEKSSRITSILIFCWFCGKNIGINIPILQKSHKTINVNASFMYGFKFQDPL